MWLVKAIVGWFYGSMGLVCPFGKAKEDFIREVGIVKGDLDAK